MLYANYVINWKNRCIKTYLTCGAAITRTIRTIYLGFYMYLCVTVVLCCRCRSERPIVCLVKLCLQLNPEISPWINSLWRTWALLGDCRSFTAHKHTKPQPENFVLQISHFSVSSSSSSLYLFCHFSPLFESDVSLVWDYRSSVEQYSAPGGTAKSSVAAQVEHLRNWLKKQAQWPWHNFNLTFWIRFTETLIIGQSEFFITWKPRCLSNILFSSF